MADSTRTLRAIITGSSAGAVKAFEEVSLAADKGSKAIGDSVDTATDKVGGLFTKLGNSAASMGIPFANVLTNIGSKFDDADTKGQKFTQTLSTLGGLTALVGVAGIAGVAAESVKLGSAFQATETSIAANAGISVAAAQKIGAAFLDTAGTTIFSGQEIGTAYAQVGAQFGQAEGHALDASQALSVMKVSMDLAEGSSVSLTSATSSLASVMQTFHLGVSQASMAGDVLFNTSKDVGTSVDTVTASITRLHSSLGANAPSLQATAGLMLDLKNNGETSRQAVSGVSTALAAMADPSAKAIAAMAYLGINLKNAQGQFIGIGPAIDQLKAKVGSGSQAQAILAAALGISSKAAAQLLPTIQAGSVAFNTATSAVSKAGAAHAAAQKQAQTLQHQIDVLKASVIDAATKWGTVLIPILEKVGKVIVEVGNYIVDHKALLVALGVTAAAIFTFMLGFWVANTIAAASFWVAATGGIAVLVAAIAVGIAWLVTHWSQVWADCKAVIEVFWQWLDSNIFQPIEDTFLDVLNFIEQHWELIVGFLLGPIALAVAAIYTYWGDISSGAATVIDDIVGFFTGLPGKIVSVVGSGLDVLAQWGTDIVTGIANAITGAAGAVFNALKGVITDAIKDVKSAINSVPVIGPALSAIGLATGGYVTKPTLALVGEAGPEFVIPESFMSSNFSSNVVPLNRSQVNANAGAMAAGAGGRAAPVQYVENMHIYNDADSQAMANQLGFLAKTYQL